MYVCMYIYAFNKYSCPCFFVVFIRKCLTSLRGFSGHIAVLVNFISVVTIFSQQPEVQQGNPLGPLHFSLVILEMLNEIGISWISCFKYGSLIMGHLMAPDKVFLHFLLDVVFSEVLSLVLFFSSMRSFSLAYGGPILSGDSSRYHPYSRQQRFTGLWVG